MFYDCLDCLQEYAPRHEFLPTQLHDLLTMVESLYEKNVFNGSANQLFAIVEEFAHLRPVSVCFHLA